MTQPIPTQFDNNISNLYRWSNYYGQPIRYIIVQEGQYISLFQLILGWVNTDISLATINDRIQELSPILTSREICMLYYACLISIKGGSINEVDLLNDINSLLVRNGIPTYTDVDELRQAYKEWSDQFNASLSRDSGYS